MITLVGVGHVFRLNEAINRMLADIKPDAVCLELDANRLNWLLAGGNNQETSARGVSPAPPGGGGFLLGTVYRRLAKYQSRLAGEGGTAVGSEMLAAYKAASELNVPVYCIDIDISESFRRAFASMRLREKARLFMALFGIGLGGRKVVDDELKNYEENEEEYMQLFEKQFPSFKHVLTDERNDHMAHLLRELSGKHSNIAAVVGDGHVEGISKLLADLKPKIVRLKEMRVLQERLDRLPEGNSSAGFSFVYR
ncbi:MAG: TraB domain-containing protein [Methanomassiliicoccales archaeon]